jgi:hypothetical protein
MQQQSYEFVEVSDGLYQLPFTLRQSNPKLSRLPGLVLMTTLAGVIVVPQLALAACAFASPDVRSALIEHPVMAVELALAFAFWVGLVCWPLRNILMALISHRFVDIRDGVVEVIDETPFSVTAWRTPLATYEGIALNIRSSLSGIRHEAVLVHPNRRRSVVLMVAEHIGEGEIRELGQVLDLPVVAAGWLYDFGGPSGGNSASGPAGKLGPVAA